MTLALLFLLLQGADAPRHGLWMGSVQICRDTVARVRLTRDHGGTRALLIDLKPAAQPRFGEETAALLSQQMPIRLDGRIVSAPYIYEPILGLQAQVSGPGKPLLKAAAKAAKKRC